MANTQIPKGAIEDAVNAILATKTVKGACKNALLFNGVGTAVKISDIGGGTVSRISLGTYLWTFGTEMDNDNYLFMGTCADNSVNATNGWVVTEDTYAPVRSTTQIQFQVGRYAGGVADNEMINVSVTEMESV